MNPCTARMPFATITRHTGGMFVPAAGQPNRTGMLVCNIVIPWGGKSISGLGLGLATILPKGDLCVYTCPTGSIWVLLMNFTIHAYMHSFTCP